MSWMQKLYETYERCAGSDLSDANALLPIAHTTQQAHIEIVLDEKGNFRRARLVEKDEPGQPCVVPATEKSAGRTSGEAPHPLCDKVQYCARDYAEFGGTKAAYFGSYERQLANWCASPYEHPKATAVLRYIQKGTVVSDLVHAGVLQAVKGRLILFTSGEPTGEQTNKSIFRLLTPKDGVIDQGDAFVRWCVEVPGALITGTWEDPSLVSSWQQFEANQRTDKGFCAVTGYAKDGADQSLAEQHPAKIRHGADKAKLISSQDEDGFTYRGRFLSATQAVAVSFEVTQKAHNALRWLVSRKQAFRNGDQVFVSWAPSGKAIPDLMGNTMALLGEQPVPEIDAPVDIGDVGQEFARRLSRAIAGYSANLDDSDEIVVMGLDSATTGRLAITYYRELRGSEFLARIHDWHRALSWHQNFGKEGRFCGAPSPRDIAEAAYGPGIDEKLRKAAVERLLPCIIDGVGIPFDLVASCTRRAFARSRPKGKQWEWEKCLGIACALYKGFYKERGYSMALETDRKTRDYLYGRLLAVAEHLEGRALYVARENRDTTAARLFQRFADRPCQTWRNIALALGPYKNRLRASSPGFLWAMERLLDEIHGEFSSAHEKEAFTNDSPLSGEFLLGYHCQRQALQRPREETESGSAAE